MEVGWFYDAGCCLCKYHPYECEGGSDTSSTPSAPSSQRPASDSDSAGSCGSIEYDTDYWGADIVPVTSEWSQQSTADLRQQGTGGRWPLLGMLRLPCSPSAPPAAAA